MELSTNGGERDHAHDAVELAHLHFSGFHCEIVFRVVGNVAAAAEDLGDFIDGLIQHVGISLDANPVFVGGGINFLEGVVRDQHAAVLVVFAEAALGPLEHTNYLEIDAVDHDVLADGRDARGTERARRFRRASPPFGGGCRRLR